MATWTAAELADAVLTRLNIKSPAETASAEDTDVVTDIWTQEHSELQRLNQAPFTVGAIPEWAQQSIKNWVAYKAAPSFGFSGQRLLEIQGVAMEARRDLQAQNSVPKEPLPVKARYF